MSVKAISCALAVCRLRPMRHDAVLCDLNFDERHKGIGLVIPTVLDISRLEIGMFDPPSHNAPYCQLPARIVFGHLI